jgi:hypothetical protein
MLDEPIDGYERENWMAWDFEMHDSPMARAYSYLRDLPLDDGKSRGDFDLGSLSFVEGDRPGSNLTYVGSPDVRVLAMVLANPGMALPLPFARPLKNSFLASAKDTLCSASTVFLKLSRKRLPISAP